MRFPRSRLCMDRTKVCIMKLEISMRTGRCPMSAAAQGAFVDIFYIIKSLHPIPRRPPEEHAVSRGESSRITIQAFDSIAYTGNIARTFPKSRQKLLLERLPCAAGTRVQKSRFRCALLPFQVMQRTQTGLVLDQFLYRSREPCDALDFGWDDDLGRLPVRSLLEGFKTLELDDGIVKLRVLDELETVGGRLIDHQDRLGLTFRFLDRGLLLRFGF